MYGISDNSLYWKGPTKFTVDVINDFIISNNIEGYWVSDIQFTHINDTHNNINTKDYLLDMQTLETALFSIAKVNHNTFRINFTAEFMNNYNRSIVINFRVWADELGAYVYCGILTKEISFAFLKDNANITRRELAPYELIFLTNKQLRVMRNLFYARHGYVFRSNDIPSMFDYFNIYKGRTFYEPNPNFRESMLTDIDRANIATIQRLEALDGD